MTNGKIKESYTQYLKEYASKEELEKFLGYPVNDVSLKKRNERVDEALAKMSSKELYKKAWTWQTENALDKDDKDPWEEMHIKFGDIVDLTWGNVFGRFLVTDNNMNDICICEEQDLDEYHRDLYDKDVMAIGISFDVDRAKKFGTCADSDHWSEAETDLLHAFMLCVRVNVNRDDVVHDDESSSVRYGNDEDYDKAFYKSEIAMLHGLADHLWNVECKPDIMKEILH